MKNLRKYEAAVFAKLLGVVIVNVILVIFNATSASAQSSSLSITPSLLEVMVQPGKHAVYTFVLTNNGDSATLTPKIIPFVPRGTDGEVQMVETGSSLNPEGLMSLTNPSISWNQKFTLRQGEVVNFVLAINPPENSPEGDYYSTLLFKSEPKSLTGRTYASGAGIELGANILLTVSKSGNPVKTAKVAELKGPTILDSLSPLTYSILIENTGNAFFKPIGKLTVSSIFGPKETLTLAPQNILAGSSRKISCLTQRPETQDNEPVPCKLSTAFPIGPYRATLEFTPDDSGNVYKEEVLTFAFPFYLAFAGILFGVTLFILVRLPKRKTRTLD